MKLSLFNKHEHIVSIFCMNKTKKFLIYRGRVEINDSIFGWICFFFHSLSIVHKEYESLETARKIRVNVM